MDKINLILNMDKIWAPGYTDDESESACVGFLIFLFL